MERSSVDRLHERGTQSALAAAERLAIPVRVLTIGGAER